MNIMENNEYNFLFLMNKCVLLFNYIDIYYQKEILTDIKYFIKRLGEIYENKKFDSIENKKYNILNGLNKYLSKIIDEKIIFLVENQDDNFITTINNSVLKTCNEIYKKKEIEEKYNIKKNTNESENLNDTFNKKINEKLSNTENIIKEGIKEEIKKNVNVSNTQIIPENHLKEFEKKIDNKIKNIFTDIENNIKLSLKDYIEYTIHIKNDVDRKNDIQIKSLNSLVDNKLSKLLENLFEDENLNKRISNNVKTEMNDLYKYIDDIFINIDDKIHNFEKKLDDNNTKINTTISNTIEIINNNINNNIHSNINELNSNIDGINSRVNNLSTSFNTQLETILKNMCNLFADKNNDLYNFFDTKINNEKNNYQIIFDKTDNIVKLMYNDQEISSTKINIKGLMGPKGQQGNVGDKGDTPIIKDISLTDDKKIKFIIYDGNNIYEVISNNTIPLGPQGIQGERGPVGKTFVDLNWKQESVMRLDEDNNNNLIILKSLSIGERSHCLKENSISVGGSQCYKENSFSIGPNSKTLDNNSIAFYGSTIGSNSFAYRADNVDENSIVFGKSEKGNYNIDRIDLNSREINLECDVLNIKAKNMYNSKIKELEEKIINMDKKINDLIKRK
jgi:hypothetical protein